MFVKDCGDALIHSVHVVAETIAFLMGMHLMLLLHLVQFFTSHSSEDPNQQRARRRIAFTPEDNDNGEATDEPILRRPLQETAAPNRSEQQSPLHLPSLSPRSSDDKTVLLDPSVLLLRFDRAFATWTDLAAIQLRKMADRVEANGGRAGSLIERMRHCESHLDPSLLGKLPSEIVNHILILAAMPSAASISVPTKIAVLSKAHHRMITARLYANVHLSDATTFRRFRMTLAVHNPQLGRHVRALSVASSKFDTDGYLPDQVAEHVTLGVGIEQILLATPNLQYLYLDLFSLAALHNGTASRLEKGALPISLCTEFSLPQYLTLPTFVHLRHVELTVFGLDNNAVEWLRQVLPRLQSLTLRWVTRRGQSTTSTANASDLQLTDDLASLCDVAWQDQEDLDLEYDEVLAWRPGGRRHDDFLLFIEAVELLRRWPYHSGGTAGSSADGRQLAAVTVFAWPKAYRELRKHYGRANHDKTVVFPGLLSDHENGAWRPTSWWDKSSRTTDDDGEGAYVYEASERRPSEPTRRTSYFQEQHRAPLHGAANTPGTNAGTQSVVHPPSPLRVAVDTSYALGPRRGPLEQWRNTRRAGVWA